MRSGIWLLSYTFPVMKLDCQLPLLAAAASRGLLGGHGKASQGLADNGLVWPSGRYPYFKG